MGFKKCCWVIGGLIILLLSFFFFSKPALAQFAGDLGSISGTVRWSTYVPPRAVVDFLGNTTGYHDTLFGADFDTGYNLPPDTYTVTAKIYTEGGGLSFVIGSQTISVTGGQAVTNINFDASTSSGLVKGNLKVGETPIDGLVQFCAPEPTAPCPIGMTDDYGPWYTFGTSGFRVPLLPGNYRAHVKTLDHVDAGIVPITVVAGQVLENQSLQFGLSLGSISGTMRWGGSQIIPDNAIWVKVTGNTSGYNNVFQGSNFDTGNNLPPDIYILTASLTMDDGTPSMVIGSQTVDVSAGQNVGNVSLDASTVSGLVKGSLSVNGVPVSGSIQFCSPNPASPCPVGFTSDNGPFYSFGTNGFSIPVAPGDYRVHVKTVDHMDAGIVPISVVQGQVIADPSLNFVLNLGSISGIVRWGTETPPGISVRVQGQTSGFSNIYSEGNFNTGFNLPADTYTVTASIVSSGGSTSFLVGSQTVTLLEGQVIDNINFDASTVSGLVKGSLKVNGSAAEGMVQFCSVVPTDPCPIGMTDEYGPWYTFTTSGFSVTLAPGNYRVHVTTIDHVDMGILPVTITAGEVLNLATSSVFVPTGQNVTVSLAGIEVTFTEVTTSGFMNVTITAHPQGGQPPSQYRFLGTYYELTTTATYTGLVTIKFPYNDADVHGQEANLKLFHWDGIRWQDITVPPVDTINNIITGSAQSLSPFAIGDLLNSPPTVDAGGPYSVEEGSSVSVSASGSDPENGALTYAWDLDNNGSFETVGQSVPFSAAGFDGPSSRTVKVQVTDNGGLTATGEGTVNVTNVAPSVGTVTGPIDPVAITTTVTPSVDFDDPGMLDTHTAVWDWGDNTTSAGTITGGNVIGNRTYSSAGVYTVKVTVTDDDGGQGEQTYQFVVIYDPNGGFVTGGGWIDSPSGAYTENPTLTGKANFGFVSKYEQGATVPTGNTKFQFKVGDLNFDSTSYDWLVVAGPNAKYKGSGTINGSGDYGFMLTARDGQVNGGGGVDKFRIKIWDKATGNIVYDNQLGNAEDAEATDAIEAGSIVIHH